MGCTLPGMTNDRTKKWRGGERLRKERERREWTRRDVEAELVARGRDPISPSTLEKWEAGKAEPSASRLAALARLYDVTLDYLFELEDAP
jgi:transcriptional regulator with XRE-family HTH domain